jgi:hypothetical protein
MALVGVTDIFGVSRTIQISAADHITAIRLNQRTVTP